MNVHLKTNPKGQVISAQLARGSLNLYWLISPYGLAFISLLPLALSLLISRDTYELFANESCLMCGSIWMPVFCLLCTAAFVIGVALQRAYSNPTVEVTRFATPAVKRAELKLVTIGLLVLVCLNFASFLIILSNTSGLVALIISGGGDIAKEAINTEGSFSQVQPVLIYYNAYALARYLGSRAYLSTSERRLFSMLLLGSILITILIAVAKVARYEMIPIICSLLFVLSENKARTKEISNSTLLKYLSIAFLLIATIFAFFSALRGYTRIEEIVGTFIGYGPASYNHLVALLNGELRPTYAGSGLYAFPFIGHIPLLESIFKITQLLGLPNAEMAFISEFIDTEIAGLNKMYIWITMYGYLYADLGYATFLFMLVYGYITSTLFANYRNGGAVGAFLYPMIFVAMILMFSFNILLRPSTIAIVAIAFFISKIEKNVRKIAGKVR